MTLQAKYRVGEEVISKVTAGILKEGEILTVEKTELKDGNFKIYLRKKDGRLPWLWEYNVEPLVNKIDLLETDNEWF